MALKEQQDLLARLYTDPHFAEKFFEHPYAAVPGSGISVEEAQDIAASAQDEIRVFADSLIWKRLREADKLLPVTRKFLGGDFEKLFREHAEKFNPTFIKKHFEDAVEFRVFLDRSDSVDSIAKDVVKFETLKLRHFGEGRRLTICSLRHDVRPVFDSQESGSGKSIEKRRSVAIWSRLNKRNRFLFI